MWPILELRLGQNGFEQLKSRIFERITLHVDIDKRAYLACAPEKRREPGADMGNRIRGGSRTDLGIQGGNFDRQIYNREKLYAFSEWVCPSASFTGEFLQ